LVGKEGLLLQALVRAEVAHDTVEKEVFERSEQFHRFVHIIGQHKAFSVHFNSMMASWQSMTDDAKARLIWVADGHTKSKSPAEWISESEIGPAVQEIEKWFHAIQKAADEGVVFPAGRRGAASQTNNASLRPLYAFVAELRAFWHEQTRSKFTRQFAKDQPLSPAAKFVDRAASYFEEDASALSGKRRKYVAGNVDTVMTYLLAGKQFKPEHYFYLPRAPEW
jgi:hypothetical protein